MPTQKHRIIQFTRDEWSRGYQISHVYVTLRTHRIILTDTAFLRQPCQASRKAESLARSTRLHKWPVRSSRFKEKRPMLGLPIKKHAHTTELDRHITAQVVPILKRRASARTPQTEPVPAISVEETGACLSRARIRLLLFLGFFLGLLLIFLGSALLNQIDETVAHWHGGDGYVTTLDAGVGHGDGASHFLAFYQNGYVTVIECSADYKTSHTYPIKVDGLGNSHHALTLHAQTIDGKRDLVIAIDTDTTFGMVLYNTGDGFSTTAP